MLSPPQACRGPLGLHLPGQGRCWSPAPRPSSPKALAEPPVVSRQRAGRAALAFPPVGGRKPRRDPWYPLGSGQRWWAAGGEGQAGWGSPPSCPKAPQHRAGVGDGQGCPLGRAVVWPQQGQGMSRTVAHRAGAPCLGRGPSPSPQAPHTAVLSPPPWHPSSTGESLGNGGMGLGGRLGDRGTW